jgi:hypothetical protein
MIAICSMVRKPFNFETWIEYHLSLGVDYIFLLIEETPELKDILEKYSNVVSFYTNEVDKNENYWTKMKRQSNFIKSIKNSLINLNVDWLIHIDSDELICCNNLKEVLKNIPEEYKVAHFQNYEAIYNSDNLENPFLQTNEFLYKDLLAYCNGKSASRVDESLESFGPHYFVGEKIEIPHKKCVILHFESANFENWFDKFSTLSELEESKIEKIPFKFYRESIKLIRYGDLDRCKLYYRDKKLAPKEYSKKLFWTPTLKEKNINWTE